MQPNVKAEDIATEKLVVLKATNWLLTPPVPLIITSHRLVIDTAGATKSHWLVIDIAGATGLLLTPSSHRLSGYI